MKKTKLMAAVAAATMAATSLVSFPLSASATSYLPYMLGDVTGDFKIGIDDASAVFSAMSEHGLAQGSRVSVSYVQSHLSDWFPNAVCATAADADQDGYISYEDGMDILQAYSNYAAELGYYKNIGNLYVYVAD